MIVITWMKVLIKLHLLSAAILQQDSGPYPGLARPPEGGNSGFVPHGTEGRRSREQEF